MLPMLCSRFQASDNSSIAGLCLGTVLTFHTFPNVVEGEFHVAALDGEY